MKKIIIIPFVFSLFSCSTETKVEVIPQKDFCSSIHRDTSTTLSQELDSLKPFMINKTGVYVLEEGDGSMVARAWLSEYAEHTIDVQYFIFAVDNVGLIAADYLVRAADRGVKVRILVDDILVLADEEQLLTLDAHENIEIKIYNPKLRVGKNMYDKVHAFATDFRDANQRMHNKTFTVDGQVVITGGRNIADEYFDYDHEFNFRDRDVLLLGGVAKQVQHTFNVFWENNLCKPIKELVDTNKVLVLKNHPYEKLHQYACDSTNFWPQVREKIKSVPFAFREIRKSGNLQWVDSIEFVSDIPGKNDGTHKLEGGGLTTTALMNLIKNAKKSVLIESPYLVTTDLGKNLFKEAVARGVKVKILTNSILSNDNLEAFSGYQRDREKLLATGARIFEFKPDAAVRKKVMTGALQKKMNYTPVFGLHAKTMVIDGEITVIGTFNLDPRSANLNTECVTIIHSKAVTADVQQGIEEELQPENAWETTSSFNPDSKADLKLRLKVKARRVVPKGIL
jgi:cardiolipin synthase C